MSFGWKILEQKNHQEAFTNGPLVDQDLMNEDDSADYMNPYTKLMIRLIFEVIKMVLIIVNIMDIFNLLLKRKIKI